MFTWATAVGELADTAAGRAAHRRAVPAVCCSGAAARQEERIIVWELGLGVLGQCHFSVRRNGAVFVWKALGLRALFCECHRGEE
jgi:hypothetical protein